MADTLTDEYELVQPEVGGSIGSWGQKLNDDLDAIDAAVAAAQADATAALPKAGGTMSGLVSLFTSRDLFVPLGNITSTAALDLATGAAFTATVTGNVTISLTNVPASGNFAMGFLLRLTNGGAFTVSWPGSFRWANGGGSPTLTASGTDLIGGVTFDGGTTWYVVPVLNLA